MLLFKKFRVRLHHYFLQRKLKNFTSVHQTCDYTSAETIGVLFDGSQNANIETVKAFCQELRMRQKKVHLLGFLDTDKDRPSLSFDYFTMKNVNWFFIPQHEKANEFMNSRFDILLNLHVNECLPLEYISALSNSKFRIGRFIEGKTFCYDFMLKLDGNSDLKFFIEQTDHYLKLIRPHEPI